MVLSACFGQHGCVTRQRETEGMRQLFNCERGFRGPDLRTRHGGTSLLCSSRLGARRCGGLDHAGRNHRSQIWWLTPAVVWDTGCPLHEVPLHVLAWAAPQQGHRIPRGSVQGEQGRGAWQSAHPASGVTQHLPRTALGDAGSQRSVQAKQKGHRPQHGTAAIHGRTIRRLCGWEISRP